ncbi:MAG: MFS transporter [Candidatus Zixiibacteriota bacterium]
MKAGASQINDRAEFSSGLFDGKSRNGSSVLIWEGAYSNIFIILTGGAFLTGMALFLGANDFEIGVLAAAPFLMQSAQLISPFLFKDIDASRKNIVLTLGISRLLWLAVVPLMFLTGLWRLPILIGIVVLSGLLTMVTAPAWLSIMADLVSQKMRGRFFSRRNAYVAATTVVATVLASLILDWSRSRNLEAFGFTIIVFFAVIGALLAWRAMKNIPANSSLREKSVAPMPYFLAPLRDQRFRKVLIVFAVWNMAVGLSAAFFAPHMLINLKMSFFQIGLYSCAAALIAVASSSLWGRYIDRFGSKTILNICAFGISLIPLIWLLPHENSIWILIPEVAYSRLLWAGFNVAAFTLPLDKSPRIDRTVYLSVFAAITGLAFFAASILAGLAAEAFTGWTHAIGSYTFVNYHLLFVGSAILRFLTAVLIASYHEPAEMRLPAVIQLMGYAVLKRMSIGRQIFPFTAYADEPDKNNEI